MSGFGPTLRPDKRRAVPKKRKFKAGAREEAEALPKTEALLPGFVGRHGNIHFQYRGRLEPRVVTPQNWGRFF